MLKRLTYGNIYGAVEHTVDAHSNEVFNLLLLQKKKNELQIKQKEQFSSFENVVKALETQKHLFLIINNTNVLSKEVENINNDTVRIVHNTFPNINLNDFYYEVLTTNKKSFVVICRKNEVDAIIKEYQKNGISIIGFSLGNISAQNLLPFINENGIKTSNSIISIKDKQIQSIDKKVISESNYSINNLEVSNSDILPLSGVLSYYLQDNVLNGLEEERTALQKDFQQKKAFTLSLYGMLGFILAILLVNFLFFSSYRSDINQLTSEIQLNESYKKQLLQLQEQVSQKEKLLKGLQSVSNSKVSLYLDKIASEIPNTILLSELKYQPLEKRIKKDKQIQLEENVIIIAGSSKKDTNFNAFVEVLGQKKWIDTVTILSYGKEKNTDNAFEISLKIKDE